MFDHIRNSFKKEKAQEVRFCNSCGFVWQEDPAGKTSNALGRGLCPHCLGIDTQLETAQHKATPDTLKESRERYLKSHPQIAPEY
jgi:hypothetical protein